MGKFEYNDDIDAVKYHLRDGNYKAALELASNIDYKKLKSQIDLDAISNAFEKNKVYDLALDALLYADSRQNLSPRLLYKVVDFAILCENKEIANEYYRRYISSNVKDDNIYILKYRLLKLNNEDIKLQIEALKNFNKAQLSEKYMYELAALYFDNADYESSNRLCDDIILFFGYGEYVDKAEQLKKDIVSAKEAKEELIKKAQEVQEVQEKLGNQENENIVEEVIEVEENNEPECDTVGDIDEEPEEKNEKVDSVNEEIISSLSGFKDFSSDLSLEQKKYLENFIDNMRYQNNISNDIEKNINESVVDKRSDDVVNDAGIKEESVEENSSDDLNKNDEKLSELKETEELSDADVEAVQEELQEITEEKNIDDIIKEIESNIESTIEEATNEAEQASEEVESFQANDTYTDSTKINVHDVKFYEDKKIIDKEDVLENYSGDKFIYLISGQDKAKAEKNAVNMSSDLIGKDGVEGSVLKISAQKFLNKDISSIAKRLEGKCVIVTDFDDYGSDSIKNIIEGIISSKVKTSIILIAGAGYIDKNKTGIGELNKFIHIAIIEEEIAMNKKFSEEKKHKNKKDKKDKKDELTEIAEKDVVNQDNERNEADLVDDYIDLANVSEKVLSIEEYKKYVEQFIEEINCELDGREALLALHERIEIMQHGGEIFTLSHAEKFVNDIADIAEKQSPGNIFMTIIGKDKRFRGDKLLLKTEHFIV